MTDIKIVNVNLIDLYRNCTDSLFGRLTDDRDETAVPLLMGGFIDTSRMEKLFGEGWAWTFLGNHFPEIEALDKQDIPYVIAIWQENPNDVKPKLWGTIDSTKITY